VNEKQSAICTQEPDVDRHDTGRFAMAEAALKTQPETAERELTDGFHLVIEALKLNGIKTIYNVPGIPITECHHQLLPDDPDFGLVRARNRRSAAGRL
jgi:hypothetical protein